MKRIAMKWLAHVHPDGWVPHRWQVTGEIVAQSVIDHAEAMGWITARRVDDCWITEAGRAEITAYTTRLETRRQAEGVPSRC